MAGIVQGQRQVPDYTQTPAFMGAFSYLQSRYGESAVSGIWCSILSQAFPAEEGYVCEPQYHNSGGFSDMTTIHYRPNAQGNIQRRVFLITQAKRSGLETTANWLQAEDQLNRYLAPLAPRHPILYGIVAIGKQVKFFVYSRRLRCVRPMRRQNRGYHISDDASLIIRRLTEIKRNH
ncbi:hypothetical protein BJX61DRAFT_545032 [Aspergillus egyptiacus]|nr:hypothetical protein BJX61DRAFT_545032 [Aspergillus egyptiacus]